MIIIPAIDLIDGSCVRLYKGDFEQKTVYDADPLDVAKSYEKDGAQIMHIVDLDGAKNQDMAQLDLIQSIVEKTNLLIQVGGGIRQKEQVENLLEIGVHRVVIGSLAVKDPALIKAWIEEFGADKIVLALDVHFQNNTPYIATHGWQESSEVTLHQTIDFFPSLKHVLCTDIAKDGTLQGPNIDLYKQVLASYPDLYLQASGGVSSLDDLRELKSANMPSCIVGKALYEKNFTLKEALSC